MLLFEVLVVFVVLVVRVPLVCDVGSVNGACVGGAIMDVVAALRGNGGTHLAGVVANGCVSGVRDASGAHMSSTCTGGVRDDGARSARKVIVAALGGVGGVPCLFNDENNMIKK
jgi:hypothetical protein